MRNLDSCCCWWCTLCPCKVRNKFLVNFWNRTILLCISCIWQFRSCCQLEKLPRKIQYFFLKSESRQLCALTRTPYVVQRVTFIMAPNTAALSHTKPPSTETYRDCRRTQGHNAHVSRDKSNMTFSSTELGSLREVASLACRQEILNLL